MKNKRVFKAITLFSLCANLLASLSISGCQKPETPSETTDNRVETTAQLETSKQYEKTDIEKDGFKITLDERFTKVRVDGCHMSYDSNKISLRIFKYPFAILGNIRNLTEKEYAENIISSNNLSVIDAVKEENGLTYFHFKTSTPQNGKSHADCYIIKSENAFYRVEFYTESAADHALKFELEAYVNSISIENDKEYPDTLGTFRKDGFKITLSKDFAEAGISGYFASYTSNEVLVLVIKETFAANPGADAMTLMQYTDTVIKANNLNPLGDIDVYDNYTSFEYSFMNTQNNITYIYTLHQFKSEDAFYIIQIATSKELHDTYYPRYRTWMKSVEFDD